MAEPTSPSSAASSAAPAAVTDAVSEPHRAELAHIWTAIQSWWQVQVKGVDQRAVIEKVQAEGLWSARYSFMICMSAGIAILGLVQSSPAVVIGAMLLSPLMGPIMAIGFALAIGDSVWLRDSGKALGIGAIIAILFCALIVLLSPLQNVTEEIQARTRPNLFDLAIAFFSALAGAYAMIRGRDGTIVGVAIATALMPPLATVGFGLATWNWAVFGGAFALFFTNLVTIALSATVMARLYGFRTNLSSKQTMLQSWGIFAAFIILAIPLGFSLRQIAWEARASGTINASIRDQFDRNARVSQIDVAYGTHPISVTATVLTTSLQPQAETLAERTLERELGRKVDVSIRQFRVDMGSGDATAAARIANARTEERQRLNQMRDALAQRLALVAGVDDGAVFVDPVQQRATVRAAVLPDAGLATYSALESRVAKTMPDWQVEVVPPAAPLPSVPVALTDFDAPPSGRANGNVLSDEERAAAFKAARERLANSDPVKLAVWAAKRIGAPVGIAGEAVAAQRVADALGEQGVDVRVTDRMTGRNTPSVVTLSWLPPQLPAGSAAPAAR